MTKSTEEYEAIRQAIEKQTKDIDCSTGEGVKKYASIRQKHLPSREDKDDYCRFLVTRREEQECADKAYMEPQVIPRPEVYFTEIKTANLIEDFGIANLTQLLNLGACPYIGLGTLEGTTYRLVPNTNELIYDVEPNWGLIQKLGCEVMHAMHLGVTFKETTATVKGGQYINTKDPASTADSETNGFVFYQLGKLECWPKECGGPTEEDKADPEWYRTDYAVGVKLSHDGTPGSIYIFMNFRPKYEYGDRTHFKIHQLGYLPGVKLGSEKITCARIAKDILDLKPEKEFALDQRKFKRPEYVMVAKTKDGEQQRLVKMDDLEPRWTVRSDEPESPMTLEFPSTSQSSPSTSSSARNDSGTDTLPEDSSSASSLGSQGAQSSDAHTTKISIAPVEASSNSPCHEGMRNGNFDSMHATAFQYN
ncbi:hypothetical protein CC80DRAFT_511408 [Byssothecium circinans]|uniref:Uncharacterized protein n=1 Tax=Byssothecium circinans TaxID=147558 RepID=A0A6A5T9G1_9PLEO|nr:hypothetical protein CC80DRAFT_511408 [Byssothecium circinans]